MSIRYYENISARRSFKSCNMQCVKQQLPRAAKSISNN